MASRCIYLTRPDATRLAEWMRVAARRFQKDRESLKVLRDGLKSAQIVEPESIPDDVVTMRSEVRLVDNVTGQEMRFTLVFPEDAIAAQERLSVLAPLGTAVLGCRVGDEIRFRAPVGWRRVLVAEVIYQPEAAGHFNL